MMEEAAALVGDAGKATLIRGKMTHPLAELLSNEGSTGRRIGSYSDLNGITSSLPGERAPLSRW